MRKILNDSWQIVSGFLILLTAFIIAFSPVGASIVLLILTAVMFVYAVRQLWLYFSMARYMVGGTTILFTGLIALDFSLFLLSVSNIRSVYIMIYLIVIYFATGAIDFFRALEIRKMHDRAWLGKAAYGLFNVVIAVLCIIFIQSDNVLCKIYGFGLFLTGIRRILQAFKKTEMVYIQ